MARYLALLLFIGIALLTVAQSTPSIPSANGMDSFPDAPSVRTKSPGAFDNSVATKRNASVANSNPADNLSTIKLTLLSEISSKVPTGSKFLARVASAEDGDAVLPSGSVVEGHVQTIHARRMLRSGAMRLIFDRIKLPDGTVQPANLYLIGSESNSVKFDEEGAVHPAISKKRLALQLGGTAAIAKLADDIAEEALAAGQGSARLYGLGAAGMFLILQKGREAKLKEGENIKVGFKRLLAPSDFSRN